jgi:hypothetical protein
MRHHLFRAIVATTTVLASCTAQAGGVNFYTETGSVIISMKVTEKMVNNDSEYSQGRLGNYVFIASALPDGAIHVGTIENVANCTGVRPRFGLTQPTPGYFRFPSYVVYYGPYATKDEAVDVRRAVTSCVPDAYNKAGVILRF